MNPETKQILFSSPLVRIEKVVCQRARRGLSCAECKSEHQISFPLSGVNVRQVGGIEYTNSPLHITFANRDEEYRIAHPYGSGESQLNFVLEERLLLNMVDAQQAESKEHRTGPFSRRQIPGDANLQFAARLIATRAKHLPEIESEESSIELIDHILARSTDSRAQMTLTQRDVALAKRAKALLASCYSEPVTLENLASALDVSVYHLCRVFKRAAGTTLWSDLQKLRTRAALTRLEDGASDLTDLGLALGYSHHSHFTASFRRELGITPSAARRLFASGSPADIRRFMRT